MRANPVFADMPTTIFETMSGLARRYGAINLGQGFPDAPGPEALRRPAAEAHHQTNRAWWENAQPKSKHQRDEEIP